MNNQIIIVLNILMRPVYHLIFFGKLRINDMAILATDLPAAIPRS